MSVIEDVEKRVFNGATKKGLHPRQLEYSLKKSYFFLEK